LDPKNYDALHNYGQAFSNWGPILASDGEHSAAAEMFEKAIRADHPGLAAAYTALGEVLVKDSGGEQAIPIFQKAIALEPASAAAHVNLGIALADQGKLKEALADFKEAVSLDPRYPLAHYNE
jgi:tetratricopeptide (TPR) repeat protein